MANLYLISNLKTAIEMDEAGLIAAIAERTGLPPAAIESVTIVKESIDARRKPELAYVRQVEFLTRRPLPEPLPADVGELAQSKLEREDPEELAATGKRRAAAVPVIVVGAGPAGIFAALVLGEAGWPVILLERGKPVETRMKDIGQLRSRGVLDPESNICFGEGGAGAYTDGKLYTRIKSPLVPWVMQRLVQFGAPRDILIQAHPHLGTDKLVRVIKRMRLHLHEQGVVTRFETRVERVLAKDGKVAGVQLASGEILASRRVILAIGHSARDTLTTLLADGIAMEPKPFAVGVRAEHPQALIDVSQYGSEAWAEKLGAAAYHLTHQVADEALGRRGVYSFCMCPGGFIVPSPTEPGHMAINGMSNANRSTPFANSGLVVQVVPEDLERRGYRPGPLIGVAFQRDLEAAAYAATARPFAAPAMRVADFIAGKPSGSLAPSNFRPALEAADLDQILPPWIAAPLRAGLASFERIIRGYGSREANLLAVESRTSSPVRLPRDADLMSQSLAGLFPVGEGAGYAGGIVSAAVDGVKAAARIIAGA